MQETRTYYHADGTLDRRETVEVPDLPNAPDLVTLANDLAAQRARLDSAEDALFYLITDSLGGI